MLFHCDFQKCVERFPLCRVAVASYIKKQQWRKLLRRLTKAKCPPAKLRALAESLEEFRREQERKELTGMYVE